MPTKPRTLGQLKAAQRGESVRAQHDRYYDNHQRDPEMRTFYGSQRWKDTRSTKIKRDPLCQPCEAKGRTEPAAHVHHIKKARTHPGLRHTASNLLSVCTRCHDEIERDAQ